MPGSTLRYTLALSSNNAENNWDLATGKLMPSHSSIWCKHIQLYYFSPMSLSSMTPNHSPAIMVFSSCEKSGVHSTPSMPGVFQKMCCVTFLFDLWFYLIPPGSTHSSKLSLSGTPPLEGRYQVTLPSVGKGSMRTGILLPSICPYYSEEEQHLLSQIQRLLQTAAWFHHVSSQGWDPKGPTWCISTGRAPHSMVLVH